MNDPDALTLLIEAPPDEANIYKGMLEANGIGCVIQGEHHAAFSVNLIGASAVLVPRLLVREADLIQARALLAASPILDSTVAGDGVPEGSVCPVHEQKAIAICSRCGTFLCSNCGSLGSPALCEDCVAVPEPRKARGISSSVRKGIALFYLVPLGLGFLLLVLLALRSLFAKLG